MGATRIARKWSAFMPFGRGGIGGYLFFVLSPRLFLLLAKACRKSYTLQNPDFCGPPVFAGSDG